MDLIIRNEQQNEFREVEELTREAFWNLYVPGCAEHFCLHNMRNSTDFIPELDFVAEVDGKVLGNIVYTHGKLVYDAGEPYNIVSFGPVGVLPSFQKQGVGSALIRHSLDRARSMGFTAVCIYGDPRYYHRFGFRCAERYDIANAEGKYAVALLALELEPGVLHGRPCRFIESEAYMVDEDDLKKYDDTFPLKDKVETWSQAEFRIMASLVY
jgi:predicted N-acetyltransferase YhbS